MVRAVPWTSLRRSPAARAWCHMSVQWQPIVDVLTECSAPERVTRMQEVLSNRREGIHLVLDNVADPFDRAAILRTAEGLGVHHIHVIKPSTSSRRRYAQEHALDNVAMGASRWLSISQYDSPVGCLQKLQQLQLRVLAHAGSLEGAEAEEAARPIDQLDLRPSSPWQGVALVIGHETRGASRGIRARADDQFSLPLVGVSRSLNLSLVAALCLHVTLASGAFPAGSLPEERRLELLGRWLLRDVRASKHLLKRAGLEMPSTR